MIKLSLDEAYCLDYLAILLVKTKKNSSPQNVSNYFATLNEIKEQIGGQKFFVVMNSVEFKKLHKANEEIFDAVDAAKTDLVPASVVDKLNYQRYLAKQELQKKHFDTEITEKKIGYD